MTDYNKTHGPFKYVAPTESQIKAITYVREKCDELYDVLLEQVPACPERTLAIRKLEECSMWCNKAVVFDGEPYLNHGLAK